MTTLAISSPSITVADLLDQLGGISPRRVRLRPYPGTATEQDVIATERKSQSLFELVDGTLVEKAMGYRESVLAGAILAALRAFVIPRKLGIVSGADGTLRIFPGLVRVPDVAFVSRERLPGGKVPDAPIPQLVPNLAVEVLSEGNTPGEMDRKRREYFSAGVRLVWIIDAEARTASVYTTPEDRDVLDEQRSLEGGAVLPGFTLSLRELFAELDG
jgi:Uma2 family endonuclease